MTISTAPTALSYSGDDSTVNFSITWKYFLKADVVATHRDTSGTETVWTLDTDYTLTAAGVDAGGTLTATTAPATGETLVITLEPANTQTTDLPRGGQLPAASVEDALDRSAQRDGKFSDLLDRTLKVPKTDTQVGSFDLPIDSTRAGKYLAFDGSGAPQMSTGTGTDTGLRGDLAANDGSSLVGFLQSGTGAVARTVQDKGRDVASVDDFGAAGDGSTDDTTKIEDANTAKAAISLSEKNYRTSTAIAQVNGTVLEGVGDNIQAKGTIISHASGNYASFFETDQTDATFNGITLKNINITGGSSATWSDVQNKWAVKSHYPHTELKNLHIEHNSDFFGNGIKLHNDGGQASMGCWTSKMEDVRFIGTTGTPADNSSIGLDMEINGGNVKISRCVFSATNTGVWLRSGENITYENVNIEDIRGGAASDRDKGALVIGEPNHANGARSVVGVSFKGYIEGTARAAVLQNCSNVRIHDSYINAIRAYAPDSSSSDGFIYINSTAHQTTIENCYIESHYNAQSVIYSDSTYKLIGCTLFRNVTNSSGVPQTRFVGNVIQGTTPFIENCKFIRLDDGETSDAIEDMVANGSEIQIQLTSHSFTTGDTVWVEGAGGVTAANKRLWVITKDDADNITLNGSEFSGTYTSGGNVWTTTVTEDLPLLENSATYDPPSLAAGVGTTTTLTVTGAALGDYVEVSFSLDLQGMTLTGYVSSANTVSARFQNTTTTTKDLSSGTLRAKVTPA